MEELHSLHVKSRNRETENRLVQTFSHDLGDREVGTIHLTTMVDVDPFFCPASATLTLGRIGQGDGLQVKTFNTINQLDPTLHSGVDHCVDVRNCYAGLRNVGGHDALRSFVGSEAGFLGLRGQLPVERQDLCGQFHPLESGYGVLDFLLPWLEDQDVASLPKQVCSVIKQPLSGCLDFNREHPARNVDYRCVVKKRTQLLGFEGGTHKHHLEVFFARLDLGLCPRDEDLHVLVPLMDLVQNQNVMVACSHELTDKRETIGAEEALRRRRLLPVRITLTGNTKSNNISELGSELFRDPLRERSRSESTGLGDHHIVPLFQKELGNLC